VVVVGKSVVVRVMTWFLVRGQLRRSRSAQALSDAQITNRIRAFEGFPTVIIGIHRR